MGTKGTYYKFYTVNQAKLIQAVNDAGEVKSDGSTTLHVYMDRVWYNLSFAGFGKVGASYPLRWGQDFWPIVEIEFPRDDPRYSALWTTLNGENSELDINALVNGRWRYVASQRPFTVSEDRYCRQPNALGDQIGTSGVEIPNGGSLRVAIAPYICAQIYHNKLFKFYENLETSQEYTDTPSPADQFEITFTQSDFTPRINHFFDDNPGKRFPENDNDAYRVFYTYNWGGPTGLSAQGTTPPIPFYDTDYEQEREIYGDFNYRWYAVWFARQRYTLTLVTLPDDSNNIVETDIKWGTDLSDREPSNYTVGTQTVINDKLSQLQGWYQDASRQ